MKEGICWIKEYEAKEGGMKENVYVNEEEGVLGKGI